MSSQNFNEKNPPPQGPTIPRTLDLDSVEITNTTSSWPTREYQDTITENSTIDYSRNPFNFIRFNVSGSTIFTLNKVLIGSLIIAQIQGAGDVEFSSILNTIGGIPQMISTSIPLDSGTYLLTFFDDLIAWHNLTNPIAV